MPSRKRDKIDSDTHESRKATLVEVQALYNIVAPLGEHVKDAEQELEDLPPNPLTRQIETQFRLVTRLVYAHWGCLEQTLKQLEEKEKEKENAEQPSFFSFGGSALENCHN